MYLVAQIPGKMLFFVHYPSFYLDLLGWAFCIGIVTFVIISTLRSKRRESPIIRPNPMGSIPAHLLKTKGARIGKTALVIVLAASGWIWHYAHYEKEFDAWKQRSSEYQKAYAAWAARQPKKEIR